MSQITAPVVEVELDKKRHLRFDFNAAALFEQVTGKNLFKDQVLSNLSATDTRALLWACLKHEQEDLKLEDVGAMIHFGNIDMISDKLVQIYKASVPTQEGKKQGPTEA